MPRQGEQYRMQKGSARSKHHQAINKVKQQAGDRDLAKIATLGKDSFTTEELASTYSIDYQKLDRWQRDGTLQRVGRCPARWSISPVILGSLEVV